MRRIGFFVLVQAVVACFVLGALPALADPVGRLWQVAVPVIGGSWSDVVAQGDADSPVTVPRPPLRPVPWPPVLTPEPVFSVTPAAVEHQRGQIFENYLMGLRLRLVCVSDVGADHDAHTSC